MKRRSDQPLVASETPFSFQQRRHDLLSVMAVISATCLAMLLGLTVRVAVEDQVRMVSRHGVTAAVPEAWLVQNGVGELVLQARNPSAPSQQYQVSVLPGTTNLVEVAAQRSLARGRLNDTYRVLSESPAEVNNQAGYRVSYAYVNLRRTGLPMVVEGVSYYYLAAGKTIVVSYENLSTLFEDTLPRFNRLLERVVYQPGG